MSPTLITYSFTFNTSLADPPVRTAEKGEFSKIKSALAFHPAPSISSLPHTFPAIYQPHPIPSTHLFAPMSSIPLLPSGAHHLLSLLITSLYTLRATLKFQETKTQPDTCLIKRASLLQIRIHTHSGSSFLQY